VSTGRPTVDLFTTTGIFCKLLQRVFSVNFYKGHFPFHLLEHLLGGDGCGKMLLLLQSILFLVEDEPGTLLLLLVTGVAGVSETTSSLFDCGGDSGIS